MEKKENKKLNKVINKNIITSFISIIIYLIFGIISFPNKDSINDFNVSYYVILALFTFGVLLFLYFKELKNDFNSFFKRPLKNILTSIGFFIICYIILILVNSIIYSLPAFSELYLNTEKMIFPNMKFLLAYTLFAMLVYTPFVESIIFNKALNNIFKNKILFIIISGILFGLFQTGMNFNILLVVASIPYILIQMIVAFVYSNKKNIFYPIFIWFFYYAVQLFIQSSAYWA